MKIVLLVTLLFVATFAFKLDKIRADDGKVKVDFYYESLCPYCQQFIERSLKQAAATKVFCY
jgi:thiol-disulfide isomerase/thioredoxin